jgi:hypothetical protein
MLREKCLKGGLRIDHDNTNNPNGSSYAGMNRIKFVGFGFLSHLSTACAPRSGFEFRALSAYFCTVFLIRKSS